MVGRLVRWGLALVLIGVVAIIVVSVWRFSDDVRVHMMEPPVFAPAYPSVTVAALDDDRVHLALDDGALVAGVWGILTESGAYARIGAIEAADTNTVPRQFTPVSGAFGVGTEARLEPMAYLGDPLIAHGMAYEETIVPGDDGGLPAWFVSGDEATWVIVVHGLSGRQDVLRFLPMFADLGYPTLSVSLRGDPGAPVAEAGRFHWGFEEWHDVEAAIRHALAAGAEDVILFGVGSGGSAVLMTLRETDSTRAILGGIVDSAVYDVAAVEDRRLERQGLGGAIAEWGRALAAFRFGMEWTRLDQVSNAAEVRRPVLAVHGTADDYVPIELAQGFADALGDQVTFHPVTGALHGAVWNHDPAGYADVVGAWLEEVDPEPQEE